MFRKLDSAKTGLTVDNIQDLFATLSFYKESAAGDPQTLRLLIPDHEIWRFFIDGNKQDSDSWIGFEERERGYLKALYKAYQEIFNFKRKLDIDFICDLHRIATNGVEETNYADDDISGAGNFRTIKTDAVYFGLCYNDTYKNTSPDGIFEYLERNDNLTKILAKKIDTTIANISDKEFIEYCRTCVAKARALNPSPTENDILEQIKSNNNNSESVASFRKYSYMSLTVLLCKAIGETTNNRELATCLFKIINKFDNEYSFCVNFHLVSEQIYNTNETLKNRMNELIQKYDDSISKAKSPFEKLSVIVTFIQSCEQLHPFYDANCRTFCMLLANHLLMRNGYLPCIFDDPNRFDMYSHNELMVECVNGMTNTMNLIRHGKIYQVATEDILENMLLKNSNPDNELTYFNNTVSVERESRVRECKRRKLS